MMGCDSLNQIIVGGRLETFVMIQLLRNVSWWRDAHAGTLRLQCHPDIDLEWSWNLPLRFIWAAIVAEYWITTVLNRWGSLVDRYP